MSNLKIFNDLFKKAEQEGLNRSEQDDLIKLHEKIMKSKRSVGKRDIPKSKLSESLVTPKERLKEILLILDDWTKLSWKEERFYQGQEKAIKQDLSWFRWRLDLLKEEMCKPSYGVWLERGRYIRTAMMFDLINELLKECEV